MRPTLALLADHVHDDGRVLHALLLVMLGLVHDLARDEDLLNDTPRRGGDIVKHHANGDAPAKPDHHDCHHDAHGLHS